MPYIPPVHPGPSDKEIDISVAAMLRFGVSLAAAIVLLGGVMLLLRDGHTVPDYTHFHAAGSGLRSLPGVLHGAWHRDPASIIQLGLLVLIATPVARVAFCIVGFSRQRDRLYISVSVLVFVILLYSLAQGSR